MPQVTAQAPPNTFQESRRSASEGAFLAKGGALAAVEGGWVDVVLVWDTTVHGLTRHLLVPLPIHASHGDAGLRLEKRHTATASTASKGEIKTTSSLIAIILAHKLSTAMSGPHHHRLDSSYQTHQGS